jgi:hypothetical protein
MPRAIAFLTLLVLAAFCTSCGDAMIPPPSQDSAKITVNRPNIFLQGAQGQVTFEIERVFGSVHSSTTIGSETTRSVDETDVKIWPGADADKYDVYIEVQLIPMGLVTTDPLKVRKQYTGNDKLPWKWNLEPAEGLAEGADVSFQFQVDVTWEAKTPEVSTKHISGVWQNDFPTKVGKPASRLNAALYGSPIFAGGGFVTFGKGIRRRKKSSGEGLDEGEGEDIEDNPERKSAEAELEEEVSSTVYAPAQAGQGDGFLVQVFVHLPEQAASLDDIAKEADEDAKRRISNKLQKKIKRGTELTFHLLMPGLEVDDAIQSCVWMGEPACVQFGVNVPGDCQPKNIIGTVTVSEASIPIGHLKFKFKITGDAAGDVADSSRELVPAGNMVRYQQAFISYASGDRSEVLKRVQMLNLTKIKFFQDLLTLEPGDSWEKLLYEYIDKSDVFFLFWSKAASESEWVRKEVEYAIKRKTGEHQSGPEIIPVIIEGPPAAKPPAELSNIHFNDKLIYFINSRENEGKSLAN